MGSSTRVAQSGGVGNASCGHPRGRCVRTEVLSSGPQGQRWPRVGAAKGGLDQKGLVCPTKVVEYEIP